MDRPNKDNYIYCSGAIFDRDKYIDDLEKYCTDLELTDSKLKDELANNYVFFDKALDRACEQLQHIILGTNPTIQYTPQQWKEILLDDKLWNNTEVKND